MSDVPIDREIDDPFLGPAEPEHPPVSAANLAATPPHIRAVYDTRDRRAADFLRLRAETEAVLARVFAAAGMNARSIPARAAREFDRLWSESAPKPKPTKRTVTIEDAIYPVR